ncbi:MAG: hypothetical protein U0136_00820 [Bdellovibrionota bacterium]
MPVIGYFVIFAVCWLVYRQAASKPLRRPPKSIDQQAPERFAKVAKLIAQHRWSDGLQELSSIDSAKHPALYNYYRGEIAEGLRDRDVAATLFQSVIGTTDCPETIKLKASEHLAALTATDDQTLREAQAAVLAGETERACVLYETWLAAHGDRFDVLGELSAAFIASDQLDSAFELLMRAGSLKPDDPMPYERRALILGRKGKYLEALSLIKQGLQLVSDHPELLRRQAWCTARVGNLEEACNLYSRLLEEDPSWAEGWLSLADLHNTLGRKNLALDDIDHFHTHCSKSATARLREQAARVRAVAESASGYVQ